MNLFNLGINLQRSSVTVPTTFQAGLTVSMMITDDCPFVKKKNIIADAFSGKNCTLQIRRVFTITLFLTVVKLHTFLFVFSSHTSSYIFSIF